MKITIKEKQFQEILNDIKNRGFTSDGCACGEWGLPLNENLHINVYRSCRKSNNTPNDKLWDIHDIEFYKHAEYHYGKSTYGEYLEYIETEPENRLENVKLDENQKKLIINKLREITKDSWGSEFRWE